MLAKYTPLRFINWKNSIKGKPVNPDLVFGNQCVDVPKHYVNKVLFPSLGWAKVGIRGNGKDVYNNALSKYFNKVPYKRGVRASRGDIVCYHGTSTNKYGHVAVVVSRRWRNGSQYTVIEQNGFNPSGVAYEAVRNYNNCEGLLRFK